MVTILWNQQVQTDRTIHNNKPGIVMCDNEEGKCVINDKFQRMHFSIYYI